jgi:uncharacterized membrane protein
MPPRADKAVESPSVAGSVAFLTATVVGAAALETTLVPGIIIGAAAWLAPRAMKALLRPRNRATTAPPPWRAAAKEKKATAFPFLDRFDPMLTHTAGKTVTFRIISSGLDFGWNYFLLGEVAAAASLSGISLIAAPTFYFLHEAVWSTYWTGKADRPTASGVSRDIRQHSISKALAKTVTFRTFATLSEFSVNYFVVRDFVLASKLSAFGIVAGPFVYIAHEKAWERYAARYKSSESKAIGGHSRSSSGVAHSANVMTSRAWR